MANSDQTHLRRDPFQRPSLTPGPLGHNDSAAPNTTIQPRDTPGPLGINDHAKPEAVAARGAKTNPHYCKGSRIGPQLPLGMKISDDGVRFIWNEEYAPDVSERLHWPGGASGVTLGAGYDMKTRSKQQVLADLLVIGIDREVSAKAACGAGLSGEPAESFVLSHRKILVLNEQQAVALLKLVPPSYEKMVRQGVRVPLLQHEYDALVSFSYNPGGRFKKVASSINEGRIGDAMWIITSANKSGGKVLGGLVTRRKRETQLYLWGKYT